MTPPGRVAIHYRRLPDDERVFDQRVLHESDDVIVTLSEPLRMDEPMTVQGRVVLEEGSRAVWFTFPGLWHDIGLFHRADGIFTGTYANILTPPRIEGAVWHTTDLFLDLWIPAGGEILLLDEDELEEALRLGHIEPDVAARARTEAAALLDAARAGAWPPAVVREWSLERAMAEG